MINKYLYVNIIIKITVNVVATAADQLPVSQIVDWVPIMDVATGDVVNDMSSNSWYHLNIHCKFDLPLIHTGFASLYIKTMQIILQKLRFFLT